MIKTLEDCREYQRNGGEVTITREVRYYAEVHGVTYVLAHDWTTEALEEKIWMNNTHAQELA